MALAHFSLTRTSKASPRHPDFKGSGTWGPKLKTHWADLWVIVEGYRVRFSNESSEGWAVKLDADGIGSTDAYGGRWTVRFDAEREHLTIERR